jgi:large subunit ribosomal protein L24
MKQEFSTKWIRSKQPRKQRKYIANAPLHTKHKFLSANLSKDLRKKYAKRSLPLRKGDEVLIMRGSFRKKKAKVTEVNLVKSLVALENVQRTKRDGTKANVFLHPSNLQIHTLSLDDKERLNSLNKNKEEKKTESKPKENKNASS